MIHVYPVNDLKEHDLSDKCMCNPVVKLEPYWEEAVCIHNSYDGREGLELANEVLNPEK